MFPWEFCKICKNTLFAEHHRTTASYYSSINSKGELAKWNCKLWYRTKAYVPIWARSVGYWKRADLVKFEQPSKHSSRWSRLEDVLKTSLVFVFKTSWSRRTYSPCSYVFKTSSSRSTYSSWSYVFKTFSRRLQDVFKTSARHLQDVLKTSSRHFENVFKTFSRRIIKLNCSW